MTEQTASRNTYEKPQNRSLRRKQAARVAAVQALYAQHFSPADMEAVVDALVERILEEHRQRQEADDEETALKELPERSLLLTLLESARQHERKINELVITSMGEKWKAERMGPLLEAILTIGVAELLAKRSRSPIIIINEYVDLTQQYFDDSEVSFINGILATIANTLRNE